MHGCVCSSFQARWAPHHLMCETGRACDDDPIACYCRVRRGWCSVSRALVHPLVFWIFIEIHVCMRKIKRKTNYMQKTKLFFAWFFYFFTFNEIWHVFGFSYFSGLLSSSFLVATLLYSHTCICSYFCRCTGDIFPTKYWMYTWTFSNQLPMQHHPRPYPQSCFIRESNQL